MSRSMSNPRLKAGLVAAALFALGAVAGVAGERLVSRRAIAAPGPSPLTVQDMAGALNLEPGETERVGAVLDSLSPEFARASQQGPDSLRFATMRARARIAQVLPPARRPEYWRWLDEHHARMMQMMRGMGRGMTGPGMMGPGTGGRGAGPGRGAPRGGTVGGGMMGSGMMGGGMMNGGVRGRVTLPAAPRSAPGGRVPADLDSGSATPPSGTLPSAASGLPEPATPGARLVASRCSVCHAVPSPGLHTSAEWPGVIRRMRARMETLGLGSLTDAEADTVLAYLEAHANP